MKVRYNQPDSIDLEHLREMQERPGWALYRRRLLEMEVQALERLVHATPDEVPRIQESIITLRAVEAVPKVIGDEIRARARKEKPHAVETG